MAKKKKKNALGAGARVPQEDGDGDFETTRDRRTGAQVRRWETADDIEKDSEDEFHAHRDLIRLGSTDDNSRHRRRGHSEDDDMSEEEILALEGLDDSDDDENDDAEEEQEEDDYEYREIDEEDDRALETATRKLVGIREDSDEDDDDPKAKKKSKDLDEDYDTTWRGKKRSQFYDRDDEVLSDEEAAKQEEAEAMRLRRKQVEEMTEADYLDGGFSDSFARRLARRHGSEEDDENDVEMVGAEERREALASMDPEELRSVAEARASDIMKLITDVTERWDEVTLIGPVVRYLQDRSWIAQPGGRRHHQAGKEYLILKYRLLLTLLTNITFYLSLRANPPAGINPKNHPVVDVISQIFEILSSLEDSVEGGGDDSDESEDDNRLSKKKKAKKRKMKEKKIRSEGFTNVMVQVAELITRAQSGEEGGDDEQDIVYDEIQTGPFIRAAKQPSRKNELKKETKKAEVKKSRHSVKVESLADDHASDESDFELPAFRSLKSAEKLKRKIERTSKANGLVTDLSEKEARARELAFTVLNDSKAAKRLSTQRSADVDVPRFDKFGKAVPSKYDVDETENKKKKKKEDAVIDVAANAAAAAKAGIDDSALDDLDPEESFGDFGFLDEEGNEAFAESTRKRRSLYDDESAAVNGGKKKKKTAPVEKDDDDSDMDDSFDVAQQFYNSQNDATETAPTKRASTWEMLTNKGLTPHRKKENRNPRVRKRVKFEAAKKKLRSVRAVAVDRSKVGAYRGELTGIKPNLTKSIRF